MASAARRRRSRPGGFPQWPPKLNYGEQSLASRWVLQADRGAEAIRQSAHDREPEPGALRPFFSGHPVKSLEDLGALGRRYARALILDLKPGADGIGIDPHNHRSSRPIVADRIVEQVG